MATPYDPKRFLDNLSRVIQASRKAGTTRACLITTRDREQALTLLKKASTTCEYPLHHVTVAARRKYVAEKLSWERIGKGNADPSAMFDYAAGVEGGGIFAFEDCLPFLRDDGGERSPRAKLADMLTPDEACDGIVLVFVEPPEAEKHLPGMLADQILRLDVPYPRAPELASIARDEIATMAHKTNLSIDVAAIREYAPMLADGVVSYTRSAARDALRDALCKEPSDLKSAAGHLMQGKAIRLSRELAMNVLDTESAEEPIGLDYLVEYLQIQKAKMRITGNQRSRGILLIGPPGTGKTMLARSIARMVELPVVEFRISALMNSLLGETERKFAQAFATLEAMAPNVVFIDEIEKAFGDSSERDGGTMMRCTGSLLSWLSDNPYPNFIVATSNSLKRMGEIGLTMTRSERFDTAFFVDVPNAASRTLMLERWLDGHIKNAPQVARVLSSETEKFSGADIHSLVKQARTQADHESRNMTPDDLRTMAGRKRMRVQALYDEFAELRRWGSIYCEPASPGK